MKTGIEVEGFFCGRLTLFCQAEEYKKANASALVRTLKVEQLYVSDHGNLLTAEDYLALSKLSVPVVVEVLSVPDHPRYSNVHYMVAVQVDPRSLGIFWKDNNSTFDQVKFTADRYVATALASSFQLAVPKDFEGDVEL